MASISGSNTRAGIKVKSSWNTTPATLGSGNKIVAEITPSFNGTVLTARSIGSGAHMASNFTRGNYIPTISLVGDVGYGNNFDTLCALLWGTSGSPTEVTTGEGDYKHTITFNTTLNAKYCTFAYDSTSSTTLEVPSASVRSLGFKTTSVPGYLEYTAELLGNVVEFSSSTNNTAQLANLTLRDSELAAVQFEDDFWIDDQSSGALSSGDLYSLTGFDFNFARPQEILSEIKGATGNSAPLMQDIANGTFAVTVKELADHTYYTVWNAETAKKAKVNVEGSAIGGGTNKSIVLYLPRILLVQEPTYNLTSPGVNPLSLTFNVAVADSNPTGMGSTYPYWEITNALSTSLLA